MQESQEEKPIPLTSPPQLNSPVKQYSVSTPVEQDNAAIKSLGVAVSQGTADQEPDVTTSDVTSESQENLLHQDIPHHKAEVPRAIPEIPQAVPELQQATHKKPVQKPQHELSLKQNGQNVCAQPICKRYKLTDGYLLWKVQLCCSPS